MSSHLPPGSDHNRSPQDDKQPGVVIRHHGHNALVEDAEGRRVDCSIRKRARDVVCGDRVDWHLSNSDQGVIEGIQPRRSVLHRPDHRGRPKALAANIDQLLIVVAPQPPISPTLIDRYLIAAALMPAVPALVLNKTDLIDPAQQDAIEAMLREFTELGIALVRVNTREPGALSPLTDQLSTHTSILVGQSGVGKSSLVNALLPGHGIVTGELSEASGQGRHTTSETSLYHLPGGGNLIDSPGVRDFHLWHLDKEELIRGFREFHPYEGHCRFHNCRHINEPGCAIQAAADAGKISTRRLESYRRLYMQLEDAEEGFR